LAIAQRRHVHAGDVEAVIMEIAKRNLPSAIQVLEISGLWRRWTAHIIERHALPPAQPVHFRGFRALAGIFACAGRHMSPTSSR
jgi:hypothetical protein